jgi:hypothetical protein
MPAVASPKRRLKNPAAHFAEHAPSRCHQNHVGSPSAATPPADLRSSAIAEQSEPPTTYRPLGGLPLQKRQLSPHVNSDSMSVPCRNKTVQLLVQQRNNAGSAGSENTVFYQRLIWLARRLQITAQHDRPPGQHLTLG